MIMIYRQHTSAGVGWEWDEISGVQIYMSIYLLIQIKDIAF
jgi:hypothetical protein